MKDILATLSLLSLVLLLPAFIWSLASTDRLFKYLQDHHAESWASLGNPRIRIGREYTASSPPVRYFTQSKYLEIQDPKLHNLGYKAKRALYIAFSVFLIFTLSTLSETVGSEMGWL